MEPIWITGIGIVSAIGVGVDATLESLLASHTGVGPLRHLATTHHEFPVGEVALSNQEMVQRLGLDPHTPTTRTALMGMMALGEALRDAALTSDDLRQTGFVSATTVGGMDQSEQHYLDFLTNDDYNQYIATHDCGACTEMIAAPFGTPAFVTTLSTACSSAANAVVVGADALRHGDVSCVVVGGSECLTKFHLNGFNSLMILDRQLCRPFDAQRAGLNLGEGAAYLVLETRSHALQRGVRPYAVLSGYGNACDAFHQTASSPDGEGAYRAMLAALRMAQLQPSQIDYVNAHGTGTPNNDASESAAVRRVWGDALPPISSTKPFTGHTTSASGTIELVICMLAMRHGFIPPNLHYQQPDEACVAPVTQLMVNQSLKHVLCNSFGFGGNDTSVVISAPSEESALPTYPFTTTYILSATQVSAQGALDDQWMTHPQPLTDPLNHSQDPDFRPFVSPVEARRMGKILKRALATSLTAVEAAGVDSVDAVVTGTGLGCIESTELFLGPLCRDGEQLLKPTHFMQSTHNTIGSLVAIRMGCHGYNTTHAHKETSFDNALYDGWLQIQSGTAHRVLVGGHDELTPSYFSLLAKIGFLGQPGQSAGESAASFVLADQPVLGKSPLCRLEGMALSYRPDADSLEHQLHSLLDCAGITLSQVAGVMTDLNGNADHDRRSLRHYHRLFGDCPALWYKHLFGDGYTASALGLYVAVCCMRHKTIPPALFVSNGCEETTPPAQQLSDPQAILLYNTSDGGCHSLTLLSKIE